MFTITNIVSFIAGAVFAFAALARFAKRVNRKRHRAAEAARAPAILLEQARVRLEQIEALDPPEPRARKIAAKALEEIA